MALVYSKADRNFTESSVHFVQLYPEYKGPQQMSLSRSGYESGYATKLLGFFYLSNADPGRADLSSEWNIWMQNGIPGKITYAPLPPPINSQNMECCIVNGIGHTYYFSSNRNGSWDIYEAIWDGNEFTSVNKIKGPNTEKYGEWPSYMDPEGRFMLFSSIRDTGMGGDDIYISYRDGETWSDGILLPAPINSASYEDSAILSPDGDYILWSSRRPTDFSEGIGNIYYLETNIPELREFFR